MHSYSDLNLQAQLICLSTQINGNIGTITQKLTEKKKNRSWHHFASS